MGSVAAGTTVSHPRNHGLLLSFGPYMHPAYLSSDDAAGTWLREFNHARTGDSR